MRILLPDLEKSYAVLEDDYTDEHEERFDELLRSYSIARNGVLTFKSFDELHFDGMTNTDKKRFNKEISKHLIK